MDRATAIADVASAVEAFATWLRLNIGATQVYLYGPRARGRLDEWSDYHFIVVSPRFEGIPSIERSTGLRQQWHEMGTRAGVYLMCLTPEEFERQRHRPTFLSAVLPQALLIDGSIDLTSKITRDVPTRSTLDPLVLQFSERLKQQFGAVAVYLYGSRARGDFDEWSDYDFLVVSDVFEGERSPYRGDPLRKLWREMGGKEPVEFRCLTLDEFERQRHGVTFVNHVLQEALRIV